VRLIIHDPRYHDLVFLSSDIIVLVFSELASLVRKILQEEENKGVELTVYPCEGFELWNAEGERGQPV
jgi:hypothetical protein